MVGNLDDTFAFNKAIESLEEIIELQEGAAFPYEERTQEAFKEALKAFETASTYATRISRLLKKEDYETTFHTLLERDLAEIEELFNG
jgi:hypothetical protein